MKFKICGILLISCTIIVSSCKERINKKAGYHIKSKITISIGNVNTVGKVFAGDSTFSLSINVKPSNNISSNYDYGNNFLLEFSQETNQLKRGKAVQSKSYYRDYVTISGFNYAIHTDMNLMSGIIISYLRKFDKNWNLVWSKKIDKGLFPDNSYHLILTPQKELLVVLDDHGLANNNPETYIAVLKYDLNGKLLINKTYFNEEINSPRVFLKTQDQNYVFATQYGHDLVMNLLLFKINNQGDTLWSKQYPDFSIEKAIELKDSSLLFFGHHFYMKNKKTGPVQNLRIMKTDHKGNLIWEKYIKDYDLEEVNDMIVTDDGNYLFLSQFTTEQNNGSYPWLIEYDKEGKELWSKKMLDNQSSINNFQLLKIKNGFLLIGNKSTKFGTDYCDIVIKKFRSN